jgi:hypothetical protein
MSMRVPEKGPDPVFWFRLLDSIDLETFSKAYSFLGDAFLLYGQAATAFDARAFPAACLMCRATVEAACYLFLTRERTQTGFTIYTPMTLDGEVRNVYAGELTKGIRKTKALSDYQLKSLDRIVEDGNIIAHLAERSDKKAIRILRTLKTIAPNKQLWLEENDAVRDLEDTMTILGTLAYSIERPGTLEIER